MKNNKIQFVTLYPNCPNYGLVKDVGQIPYTLGQSEHVDSYLASSFIDEQGEHKEIIENFSIIKLQKWSTFFSGFFFLLRNSRKFDWINIYHGGRRCYYWTRLYKLLNPKGRVYLKLDLSYSGCQMYEKSAKELKIFEKTIGISDIVSVESEKIRELTKRFTKYPIQVIPNGYISVDEQCIERTLREKKFLTVGRLGTPEKATDILLEAFAASAKEHEWSLELVGSIEESFKHEIDIFYKKYPELINRVIFKGPIYNREQLYAEYRSARTFVLPSRWEASPLVGPEALGNGCRMILSDAIPPIKELTNNLEFGRVVETGSVESLKQALILETRRTYSEVESQMIIEYAKNNLSWDSICDKLYALMIKKN